MTNLCLGCVTTLWVLHWFKSFMCFIFFMIDIQVPVFGIQVSSFHYIQFRFRFILKCNLVINPKVLVALYFFTFNSGTGLSISCWQVGHGRGERDSSSTLTLDLAMHGCKMKSCNCSIITCVSSMSSPTQPPHESLGFLSRHFYDFCNKITKGTNPSLLLESKEEQGSMHDLDDLRVTQSQR